MSDEVRKLAGRQLAFIDAYLANGFNATQAALTAGYSAKTAYSQGQRLLKHVEIAAAVRKHLDKRAMTRDEALESMSEMARATLEDFVTIKYYGATIDLEKAQKAGKLHLLKKIKQGKDGRIEIELYDRQQAVNIIGKHHGLWKDGIEININVDIVVQLVSALQQANLDPAEVFNNMIARLNHQSVKTQADS